jgi:hypothetical protein
MVNYALSINEKYNLSPSVTADSWSQFTRVYSSAASLVPKIPLGKYAEVKDKKLNGDSFIIFRRTDFDKLNMLSSLASRATRCLVQIDRITTTFSHNEKPEQVIKLIHEQAKLGIEFSVVSSTESSSDYFKSYFIEPNDHDFKMPKNRKEIEGK